MIKIIKTRFGIHEIIQRQHYCEHCNKITPAWQEDMFLEEDKKTNIGIITKCLYCLNKTSERVIR